MRRSLTMMLFLAMVVVASVGCSIEPVIVDIPPAELSEADLAALKRAEIRNWWTLETYGIDDDIEYVGHLATDGDEAWIVWRSFGTARRIHIVTWQHRLDDLASWPLGDPLLWADRSSIPQDLLNSMRPQIALWPNDNIEVVVADARNINGTRCSVVCGFVHNPEVVQVKFMTNQAPDYIVNVYDGKFMLVARHARLTMQQSDGMEFEGKIETLKGLDQDGNEIFSVVVP